MSLQQVGRIVVAYPNLALIILPDQHFLRQIDAHCLCTFNQRRTTHWISKHDHLSWAKCLADFCGSCGMIDTRKDSLSARFEQFFQAGAVAATSRELFAAMRPSDAAAIEAIPTSVIAKIHRKIFM